VMADTGSDDGSREIAERYADVVFDFPWINDFAAARNAVMDRCSGKWYFSIDCDEWLSEDISGVVRFLRENNAEDFGSLIIRSYMTTGLERDGNYSDFMAVRFLRMSTGLRYVGAIHERWDAQGVLRAFYLKGFILHHDGYVSRGDTRWDGKQERNMPLLREKLKENPKDLAVLQQCMESGGKTPEYKDYLYRAVKGIKEKWPGWVSFGPPVLRSAIRAAIDLKLPEPWRRRCFRIISLPVSMLCILFWDMYGSSKILRKVSAARTHTWKLWRIIGRGAITRWIY